MLQVLDEISLTKIKVDRKKVECLLKYKGQRNFHIDDFTFKVLVTLKSNYSIQETVSAFRAEGVSIEKENITGILDRLNRAFSSKPVKDPFFFKVTLLNSDIVNRISKRLCFLFHPTAMLTVISLFLGLLILFFWQATNVLKWEGSFSDFLWISFFYYSSIIFHEFGHSSALKYHGIRPAEIGFGQYLYFPALYTNVSGAWSLNPRKRMLVDFGGIYFQMIYLIPVLLGYLLYDWTSVKYIIVWMLFFFVFNLNPFLKFDGYWMVSDYTSIPNLMKKSRDLAAYFLLRKENKGIRFFRETTKHNKVFLLAYVSISYSFYVFFLFYIIPRRIVFLDFEQIGNALYALFTSFELPSFEIVKEVFLLIITVFIVYRLWKNIYKVAFKMV